MKMIPLFRCTNMRRAIEFYTGILDFQMNEPDASTDDWVVLLSNDHAELMLTSLEGDQKIGIAANVQVENVDYLFKKYLERGLDTSRKKDSPVHQGPTDQSWGNREFYVTDEDGNTLRFFAPLKKQHGPVRLENITPILSVKDMKVTRTFYCDLLGFTEADWGTNDFTAFNRDGHGFYACQGKQGNPGTWVWMGFDGDIYQLHQELKSKGVQIRLDPTNYWWALEMAIEDPDGHVIRFGTEPDETKPYTDVRN